MIFGVPIEKVSSSKLLGVYISDDLKWESHIQYVYDKAASRVYFLCMLRHASVPNEDLVGIYLSILRPLLEYACQVWHPGLTLHQGKVLESVQKRALKIIFPDLTYEKALETTGLPLLSQRRTDMCHKLYKQMQNPEHKLHKLLPSEKNNRHNLRREMKYEPPKAKTKRYKNTFVPYCLYNFQ